MPSTFTGLDTVTRGLAAQQISLNTTGHNIANASTPGYSRQRVNLVTTSPEDVIGIHGIVNMLGTGVDVQSITRTRDAFIDVQYRQNNSAQAFWQNQSDVLSQIENIFQDTDSIGIQATLDKFWTALQTLAADAADSSARTNVRETANALVSTLKQANSNLLNQANDITNQIVTQVSNINNLAAQIANLTGQITKQEAGGGSANDLRDQRDNLIDQLSAITKVQVTEDGRGAFSLSTDGVVLVDGDKAFRLQVSSSRNQYYGFDTNTVQSTGTPPITVNFTGGQMASLFQARDQVVVGYLDKLDKMAQFLMVDFNAQHRQGYDLNGNAGQNFFVAPNDASFTTDYSAVHPDTGWINQLQVNQNFYNTDGPNLIAAKSSSTDGNGNGDNIALLANVLYVNPSATLGGTNFKGYYSSLVGALGVQSQQATNMAANQNTLLQSIGNWRESVSGVNIDEEMTHMIQYQKAYAAAASVLSTMNSMLGTLIGTVGGVTSV